MNRNYDQAIEDIYAAATCPDHWPVALARVAACFDDVGAFLIYARDDNRFGMIASPVLQDAVTEYVRAWSHRDTRALRAVERGYYLKGDTMTDSDVVSQDEMQKDPFYTEFLAKYGLRYFAGARVSPDPRVDVALSIQRSADREPYSEEELRLVARISRHIEQSLRLGLRIIEAEGLNQSLSEALAKTSTGVIVLDRLQRVMFANDVAEQLLGDGVAIKDRQLVATDGEDQDRLDRMISSAIGQTLPRATPDPAPVLLRRSRAQRPLIAHVMPVVVPDTVTTPFLVAAAAIVLLADPDRVTPVDLALVRDLIGLTLGEARVASAVGSGLSPKIVATQLGITENTVRTVLQRVFQKADISRQSELVSLLTRLSIR